MNGSLLEEKSSFEMLGLTFCSKLDGDSYTISTAKTAFKKFGALIRTMKFLFPEVALYLYKSTICPSVEYCCHFWPGAPSACLILRQAATTNMQGCWSFTCCFSWTLGSSKCGQLLFSVAFSVGITLLDVLQDWLNCFHFLFLEVGLLVILIDCMISLSPFLDVTRMSISTVSFLEQLDWQWQINMWDRQTEKQKKT